MKKENTVLTGVGAAASENPESLRQAVTFEE
jgi:hypothetical protein